MYPVTFPNLSTVWRGLGGWMTASGNSPVSSKWLVPDSPYHNFPLLEIACEPTIKPSAVVMGITRPLDVDRALLNSINSGDQPRSSISCMWRPLNWSSAVIFNHSRFRTSAGCKLAILTRSSSTLFCSLASFLCSHSSLWVVSPANCKMAFLIAE